MSDDEIAAAADFWRKRQREKERERERGGMQKDAKSIEHLLQSCKELC